MIFSNSSLSDLLFFFCFQAVMVRNADYFLCKRTKLINKKNPTELQMELKSGIAKKVLELK